MDTNIYPWPKIVAQKKKEEALIANSFVMKRTFHKFLDWISQNLVV
jgi:hypothetical protein